MSTARIVIAGLWFALSGACFGICMTGHGSIGVMTGITVTGFIVGVGLLSWKPSRQSRVVHVWPQQGQPDVYRTPGEVRVEPGQELVIEVHIGAAPPAGGPHAEG